MFDNPSPQNPTPAANSNPGTAGQHGPLPTAGMDRSAPAAQPAAAPFPPRTAQEPEDIFATTDQGLPPTPSRPAGTGAPVPPPFAGRGEKPAQFQPREAGTPPVAPAPGGRNRLYVMIGVIVIIILMLILGGMIVLAYMKSQQAAAPVPPAADTLGETGTAQPADAADVPSETPTTTLPADSGATDDAGDPADEQSDLLLDAIRDTDNDGLTDEEEKRLGTDWQAADTDGDGLFDRQEIRIYATDPLNVDSDNDGYSDWDEVENGYNPNGEGKLHDLQ